MEPFHDAPDGGRQSREHGQPGGELPKVDQSDGVHGPKMVSDPAPIPERYASVTGLQGLDTWTDGPAVGDHEAQGPTEDPSSAGEGGEAIPESVQVRSG